jgi:hypothetical protein
MVRKASWKHPEQRAVRRNRSRLLNSGLRDKNRPRVLPGFGGRYKY